MNLYILRPIEKGKIHPWMPWFDKAFGFVVRAESEEAARKIADENAGDENKPVDKDGIYIYDKQVNRHPWLLRKNSTCCLLTNEGDEGVVMKDFASA